MSLEIVLQTLFCVFTKVLPSISVTRLSVPNNAHFIEKIALRASDRSTFVTLAYKEYIKNDEGNRPPCMSLYRPFNLFF